MEKLKKIETHLPKEIIQHVQSFVSGKEAARTSILSKSWYNAWLTRPNLDFAYVEFRERNVFAEHVKKTMQRYEELKINIDTLRLRVNAYTTVTVSTAKEFILKAIELGASDVYIDGILAYSFPLPSGMFESGTLVRLSLSNCKIDLCDQKSTRTTSMLKYLKISGVRLQGITFWGISWMCPLIEELSIAERGIEHVHSMTVLESGLGVYVFRKLKVLSLEEVKIGEGVFDDFSSKFPCLKELALVNCSIGYRGIQICSDSLECISFTCYWVLKLRVTLDVPRIRKFKYSGSRVPSLSFKTIHREREREWVSEISIILKYHQLEKSCFLDYFLHGLSPSKITLHLHITCILGGHYESRDVICSRKLPIVVENLTLLVDLPSSLHRALLDGLFRCCHPSFVNLSWLPLRQIQPFNNEFTKFLCETLLKQRGGEKQSISALHDLEEVNVDFFIKGCRSTLPCKTLQDAWVYSASSEIHVLLQLRWGCLRGIYEEQRFQRATLQETSKRIALRDLKEVNSEDAPIEEVDDLGSIKVKVGLLLRWGRKSLKFKVR